MPSLAALTCQVNPHFLTNALKRPSVPLIPTLVLQLIPGKFSSSEFDPCVAFPGGLRTLDSSQPEPDFFRTDFIGAGNFKTLTDKPKALESTHSGS